MAQAHAAHGSDKYYIPHGSKWPAIGAITLFTTMFGVSALLNGWTIGPWIAYLGLAVLRAVRLDFVDPPPRAEVLRCWCAAVAAVSRRLLLLRCGCRCCAAVAPLSRGS